MPLKAILGIRGLRVTFVCFAHPLLGLFDLGLWLCCSGISQYNRSLCSQFSIFKGEKKNPLYHPETKAAIVVTFWLLIKFSLRKLVGIWDQGGMKVKSSWVVTPLIWVRVPLPCLGLGFLPVPHRNGVLDPQIPVSSTGRGFSSLSLFLGTQLSVTLCGQVFITK